MLVVEIQVRVMLASAARADPNARIAARRRRA
jgi:hypothetical protein